MSILARAQQAIASWLVRAAFPNPIPHREHMGRWSAGGGVEAPGQGDYQDYATIFARHVWVHRAVSINAQNFSAVPVHVVDHNGAALGGHPVTALFQNVNPAMSPGDLWRMWIINMMLAGEEFWEMTPGRSRKAFVEIWPRRPDKMLVIPDADRKMYLSVAGYQFDRGDDAPLEFEPGDVLHFKFFNPLNPYRGLRPIGAVRQGIILDIFSQVWTKMLFKNQARPDFAIQLREGQRLTPSLLTERKAYMDEKFRGVEKSHGIIILEHGETIVPFAWAPGDVQYIEQRKLARDEIGSLFGVPDELMGYGRDTWENYRVAMEAYWRLTMMPLLRHRDDAVTKWLRGAGALKPSERLVSDLSEVAALQGNINEQIEGAQKLWSMGTPPNAAFEAVGLNLHIPGGDVGYIPFTLQPLGGDSALDEPSEQPEPDEEERSIFVVETKKALALEYGSPGHWALWKSFIALTEPREKKFTRELKRQFQRQQIEVGQRLREQTITIQAQESGERKYAIEPLIDQVAEEEAFQGVFGPYVAEMVNAGGIAALAEIGLDIDFNPSALSVQDIIQGMVIRFAKRVNETTIRKLRDELAQGITAGESIPQLMERISQVFEGRKSDYETERIARTETNKAVNAGIVAGYEQGGVVQEKEWMAALDNRTRESHVAAHGQRVPLQADFEVGGEHLSYPGDPRGSPGNIISCRCRVVAGNTGG